MVQSRYCRWLGSQRHLIGRDIPGLGIALSLLFVYLCGVGTRAYAGRQLVLFFEGFSIGSSHQYCVSIYQATDEHIFSEKATHFRDVV